MANRKRNIQMKFWVTEEGNWLIDEKMSQFGSVEKVGVEPDPKRVGPASWNLEYG